MYPGSLPIPSVVTVRHSPVLEDVLIEFLGENLHVLNPPSSVYIKLSSQLPIHTVLSLCLPSIENTR